MIFLTVGTQLPFERLVRAVDDWCMTSGRNDVFGQIAECGRGYYKPMNFEWLPYLEPKEMEYRFKTSSLIIGHAGMGTIISALTHRKPIVVLPRKSSLGEHRNDHQIATVTRLGQRPGLVVANGEEEIPHILDRFGNNYNLFGEQEALPEFADATLIDCIRRNLKGDLGDN